MIKFGCIVAVGVVLFAGVILRLAQGGPDKIGTGIEAGFLVIFIIFTIGVLLIRQELIDTRPRFSENPNDPKLSRELHKIHIEQQAEREREFTSSLIFAPVIVIVACVVGGGLLYLITQNPTVDQAIDGPRIINEWRSIVGAPPYTGAP